MKTSAQKPPKPVAIPKPLPPDLLTGIIRKRKLLLCLDYDGTISEITARPAEARPVPRARETLRALAAHPERVAVAIISGRDLATLRALLRPQGGVWMAGSHGIELIDPRGKRYSRRASVQARAEIAEIRVWMKREVRPRDGFVIEDKRVAIALHYRNAKPAAASVVRAGLRELIEARCPSVAILRGKMVDEAIPRGIGGKGAAVRTIQKLIGEHALIPVYFGDDTTDEDAFRELRDDGVTIRVGGARRSWAQFRVTSPAEVVAVLGELLAKLEPGRKIKSAEI
ncbi:MAG: trehalose-phosphatase [Candidatus Binataceae bacterium]